VTPQRSFAVSNVLRRRSKAAWPPLLAAAVVAGLAVATPPAATVRWLTGEPLASPEVAAGIWAWKVLLLLHGAVLVVVAMFEWNVSEPDAGLVRPRTISRFRGQYGVLALILVGAAALRLWSLGAGLWFDEILTLVNYVRHPVGYILTTFDSQNQHPLYSLLARASVVGFGESAATLRLPAAVFGVAGVWALFWFARHVTNVWEAVLSAALLACSYHHVWFSQNARGYTSLMFWTLVSTGLFLRMLEGAAPRKWGLPFGYGAAVALGTYTHVTGALVAVGHAVVWGVAALRSRSRIGSGVLWRPIAGVLLAGSLTLLLYAPVWPQLAGTLAGPSVGAPQTDWQRPAWMIAETVRGLSRGVPGGVGGVVVGIVILIVGLWSYARERLEVTLLFVTAPCLLALLIVAMRHNLWPRFFLFAAGFGVLVALRGVTEIARRVLPRKAFLLPAIPGVVLVAGSALTVPRAWGPKQDFEGAARFIDGNAATGDAVVTVDVTEFPYRDYLTRDWHSIASAEELRDIEVRHPRTWVLYTFPTRLSAVYPDVWQRLQRDYRVAARFRGTVGGGAIVVMERP